MKYKITALTAALIIISTANAFSPIPEPPAFKILTSTVDANALQGKVRMKLKENAAREKMEVGSLGVTTSMTANTVTETKNAMASFSSDTFVRHNQM